MRIIMTAVICGVLGLPDVLFGQHHPPAPTATATSEQSITRDWISIFKPDIKVSLATCAFKSSEAPVINASVKPFRPNQ
jgi:hypothetical protein